MKKRMFSFLLACSLLLTGCSIQFNTENLRSHLASYFDLSELEDSDLQTPTYIGIVVKTLSDEYFPLIKAGAERKADELGVSVAVVSSDQEDEYAQQAEIIDILAAQQVDVLAFALPASEALNKSLSAAHAAGIPLIAMDTRSSFPYCAAYIGSDNYAAGVQLGQLAAERVGAGGTSVILKGQYGDEAHSERTAGITQALLQKGVRILEIDSCNSSYELAYQTAAQVLQRYPSVDIFCCTTDEMAMGALDAIEVSGAATEVIGFDGILEAAELVADGRMLYTIAQDAYHIGELTVETACRLADEKTVVPEIICETDIITADNAQAYIQSVRSTLYPEENN